MHVCEHFGRKPACAGWRWPAASRSTAPPTASSTARISLTKFTCSPWPATTASALGAALYRTSLAQEIPNRALSRPALRPALLHRRSRSALRRFDGKIQWKRFASLDETCAAAARLIADGRVIAWSRGRMEYGPRALGNRSILADPGHPEMRDRINAMVKKREAFRPFAPACSVEEAHRWFEVAPGSEFPYMISIVNVRPELRDQLPAITHVNGSARLQTVSVKDNPDFHALLMAVGKTTGRQMVLNTSFNVKGQPIVNTPEEAIETFLDTGIEYLFLENFHVTRAVA